MVLSQFSMQTVLLGAIATAAVLVYLPFMAVGAARASIGYDAAAPRAMFDQLPDWGKRATWAHQNAWEAFAIFTAAALMACVSGVDSDLAREVVVAHVVARSLFPVFYILNIPALRSLMFGVGSLASFTLMYLSVMQSLANAR